VSKRGSARRWLFRENFFAHRAPILSPLNHRNHGRQPPHHPRTTHRPIPHHRRRLRPPAIVQQQPFQPSEPLKMVWWLCTSLCFQSTCAQEMCIETDAVAAAEVAAHKHNNQRVYGRGALRELHRSDWWRERGGGGTNHNVQLECCLIDGPSRINTDTTTNHRIEWRGNRTSLCRERQRKGLTTHNNPPKERGWCGAQLFCYVCYMHNSKTKTN
jgi:hypothetical protein